MTKTTVTSKKEENVAVEADHVESLSLKQKIFAELKFFVILFGFLLTMLTCVWGHYKIPSESMLPTLEVGDHIYVSKFAYGYSKHSLPFMLHKLPLPEGQIFSRTPKRGDVAVFRNPKNDLVMIKRVIGLPGEVNNYLYREHKGRVVGVNVYRETLPNEEGPHLIYEMTDRGNLDNTETFIVPEGHFFFMGDNRDNSTDSRAPDGPGFVPQDHLMGRADFLMFSFKKCATEEGLRCPPRRFADKL